MTKKNEVAVKSENAVTQRHSVGRGFENVNIEEVTLPRAKLLQSNSPEVSDRDYNFRAGDVIHSLLMEKVPEKFVPLAIWNSNILFVPRTDERKASLKAELSLTDEDMEQMIICRAPDAVNGDKYGSCALCGMNKFDGAEKPWCNATINVLAVPIEEDSLGMPYVLQFSNTSFKHGRKFRDTAFYSSMGADLFSRVYKVEAIEAASGGNRWFEQKIKPAGLLPEELFKQAEELYTMFAGKTIVVDAEDDSNDATSSDISY
jgi:hypothetical protein